MCYLNYSVLLLLIYNVFVIDSSIGELKKLERLDLGNNEIEALVSIIYVVHVCVIYGNEIYDP